MLNEAKILIRASHTTQHPPIQLKFYRIYLHCLCIKNYSFQNLSMNHRVLKVLTQLSFEHFR